jgi:hypothetical protein
VYKRCARFFPRTALVDEYCTSKMCCDCGCKLLEVVDKRPRGAAQITASPAAPPTAAAPQSDPPAAPPPPPSVRSTSCASRVRGLRWCSSTSCRKFVSRDAAAARNILRAWRAQAVRAPRPRYLARDSECNRGPLTRFTLLAPTGRCHGAARAACSDTRALGLHRIPLDSF